MKQPGSTLALTPGTRAAYQPTLPGMRANAEPRPSTRPLFADQTALRRAGTGYYGWLDHVWPAAGCTHPIRLYGELATVDSRTGEILRAIPTTAFPDGVIYKACGNRRASACPSCAETYRRDAYHVIRSGLVGGKTVPASVAQHPAVFATFTAPSFGEVHTRRIRRHTCLDRRLCRCRPEPCHARRDADTCPHGKPLACFTRHSTADLQVGRPLCPKCYDYNAHVVWNNTAGELWRRTKQAIERHLNRLARSRRLPRVRVSHGKAAEYQHRGAVHFHVLLRLDGVNPDNPDALIPPPAGITAADLDDAVRDAAAHIGFVTIGHPDNPAGWRIHWGEQIDVRIITLSGNNALSDAMVAAYLAKYSTKGTEVTGHTSRRLTTGNHRLYADPNGSHTERLVAACWNLGEHDDFQSLRRWAHMLGFGGHFLTKGRHYSITFTALRNARIIYRRGKPPGPEHAPIRSTDHDEETTLVIGRLTYAGTGWHTTGDALLANTAANQARKRQDTGREELEHEYATTTQQAAA